MQKWDSEVSFAALPRLIDEALNDARDMDARTTKAYELAREKGWSPFQNGPADGLGGTAGGPGGTAGNQSGGPVDSLLALDRTPPPMVRLDWTTTGQGGYQAKQDAKALAEALTTKDPAQARNRIALLPDSLARHANDKAYLATFWTEACPLALQAARALYNRAGTALFSTESASLLRALGSSLASATQMRVGTGKDRRPLLSEATRAAITKNADPWSVGMLFKYGPDGKTWDSHFLADTTRSMLDARATGKIEVPLPTSTAKDPYDAGNRNFGDPKLQAEFDPVVAVLDRAAENGQAARHVLGDPSSGFKYAKMLVNDQWHTQGSTTDAFAKFARGPVPTQLNNQVDLSSHAAEFLKAAVSAGRGASDDAKESAWSVVNIVKATSEFSRLHPDTTLPNEIRNSLIYTADRYLPDFAASADHSVSNGVKLRGDDPHGPYISWVARSDLDGFFKQALHDPKDFGRFKGALDARISAGVTATIKDSKQNYLVETASLYGLLASVHKDLAFEEGMERDEKAQRAQTALSLILGGFGALGFANPLGPGTSAQVFLATTQPLLTENFSTDNATKAAGISAEEFRDQLLHVKVPVVQGLINAGMLKLPPDTSWLKNGTVTPDVNFNDWYSAHEKHEFDDQTLVQWVQAAEHAMNMQVP